MKSLKEKLVEHIANYENPLPIELLYHKYLYYVKNKPIISDFEYDMLEQRSRELAKGVDNGFIHDMVEFSERSIYWDKVKLKYGI